MSNAVASILRAATRKPDEPLNILCCPVHERYQTAIAMTGHNFWAMRTPQVKDWNETFAPVPKNFVLLNPTKGEHQLPPEIDFDVVMSENKFGAYQLFSQIVHKLHLPLISLEHTLPVPAWPASQLTQLKQLRGNVNVFISEFSRKEWGWRENEALVIHHGCDSRVFCPDPAVPKKPHVLSVVNQFRERDIFCGYRLWEQVTQQLPRVHVGDSKDGWSKPAAGVAGLVHHYREAGVFINTSLVSPIPTVVLEAMACGCAVVSTNNCMLPEVIEHGKNGLMSNDPKELTAFCQMLLRDDRLRQQLGEAARETILKKFSMSKFVENWRRVFQQTSEMVYRGSI